MTKKILVTGAAGFVGSSLALRLLERGDKVMGVDNFNDAYDPAQKRRNVEELRRYENFVMVSGDFCDSYLVDSLMSQFHPETIAHMGALANVRVSVKKPGQFINVNVGGTNTLLEAAVKFSVKNFVLASTSSIYGQRTDVPFKESDIADSPLAPYPATKKAAELVGHAYHSLHNINFTALRFFNVYGPRGRPDMMPYKVFESLVKGQEITLFDEGQLKRDWTYIDDITSGILTAIDKASGYQVINLGRGEPVAMNDFVVIAEKLTGKKAKIIHEAAPSTEPKITFADISKARGLLNYAPKVSLPEGLGKFWEWYQGRR
jgi:UDP-glucuronate 4-epimerase